MDAVTERIRRTGPIRFDEFLEMALYGEPDGFYTSGGGAGRRRDFLTSPEVGPLFGAVLARALDRWWDELRRPDPFVVVEAGAGAGTLARSVLDAGPACSGALHYVLVERSPVLRALHESRLPLEPARQVLGPVVTADPDEGPEVVTGSGPVVSSLAALPSAVFTGVVLANELLDNLPFRLFERTPTGWDEVRVGVDGELLVGAAAADVDTCTRLAPEAPVGGRIPLQHEASTWVRDARRLLDRGRLVVLDYADTTPSLAARPWREWVRTYRAHGAGGHPLEAPGTQDVTCEVAVDQLPGSPSVRSQAAFLADHGLEDLADDARRAWEARAHVGDLEAVAARSRVGEAKALTDPAGLGAFSVLEWRL